MPSEPHYSGGFFFNPKTQSVLLQLRDNKTSINPNKWAFFCGLSEGTETPEETFIREVSEELAIDIPPGFAKSVRSYKNVKRNVMRHVFLFETDLPKEAMTLGEGADFDWVPLADVFTYDLTDKTEDDLTYFLQSPLCYNSAEL